MSAHHQFFGAARLKRALGHFLIGKGLTAPLTLLNIVLLVRLMPVAHYGAYVTALAVVEITLAISDFGLSWAAWCFIPAYRVGGGSAALRRFVMRIAALRALTLIAAGAATWMLASLLEGHLHLAGGDAALRVAGVLLFVDGLGRYIREILFESMLLQGRTQISQLARNLVLSACLVAWWARGGDLLVSQALWFEVGAAALASLLALAMLFDALRRGHQPPAANWEPPDAGRLWRLAWPSYLSSVLNYVTGAQAMITVASKLLGAEAAATLGMARNLVEQVRKYLPSELLAGLARPPIIAAYAVNRDFGQLNRSVQTLFKTSYVLLLPFVAVVTGVGGQWLIRITGGKYVNVHLLIVLMVCTLLPLIHRRVLEIVANTVDSADLWFWAAVVGGLSLPLAFVFVQLGGGLESMVGAVLAGEVVTNLLIVRGLKGRGFRYRIDLARPLLALVASLVAGGAVWVLVPAPLSMFSLVLVSAALFFASAALVWWLRVFDTDEIAMFHAFRRPIANVGDPV